ncbi:hypothetical protein DFQ27_003545 [Actinomortierella ambigua]|uniref:WD40 repeat-like protein n=1 Tax=Actinomortierella ambigua TaxID=1343610 RepID=A0A9P6UBK8_9FUNG|nr:hypothetical protein DFQ27_003545 [Actinomortierella ambigua]
MTVTQPSLSSSHNMDDSDFAKYFPASFGKTTPSRIVKKEKKPPTDDGQDALRSAMPMSFGKQSSSSHRDKPSSSRHLQSGDEPEMPAKPEKNDKQDQGSAENTRGAEGSPDSSKRTDPNDDSDDSDDDSDLEEPSLSSATLPLSHEIVLSEHSKTISAMTLDPAGARLVTGGYDYQMSFWDFAGMDSRFKPFRTLEPCGSHQIHNLQYSLTGDRILVISGETKARIFDRNCTEIAEFQTGDRYIRDLRNTAGHVAALTSGTWHPYMKNTILTASNDGSIRIWDVENTRKQTSVIAYKTKERGGRTPVTAVAYSSNGKLIAGVWDVRNLSKPVSVADDLTSYNVETNVIFSPDERLIVTGTGVKKNEGYGKIVMFNSQTMEVVRTASVSKSSVVRVLWHDKLNQIFAGNSDGTTHVFYDPEVSTNGAKLCVGKAPKKRAVDDYEIDRPIITPHALPMFKEERVKSHKRKHEKLRKDPVASHRPDLPISGPGRGGKVGTNVTQHILSGYVKGDIVRGEDPREALLKYHEVSEKDPKWITPAYKQSQPKTVYADPDQDERERKRQK